MAFELKPNKSNSEKDTLQPNSSEKNLLIDSENGIHFAAKLLVDECCLLNGCKTITDLPPAIVSEIFNSLDPKELGIVSCVNTSLYRIAFDHHVWKEFYCERWGLPIGVPNMSLEKSWRDLFVEREFRSKTFMGPYSTETLYGHTEAVRTVFVLLSRKVIFTSGYDSVIRMWDMEGGYSIAYSRPLGCTIRAVAADSKLLIAGGSDGFIHGWKAQEGCPYLFDIKENQNTEFRLWEHQGPITCVALDSSRIYSGSWDMTIRVWDRLTLKSVNVLMHNDWVWTCLPHESILVSTSGSDIYVWETNTFSLVNFIKNAHVGNAYSLARSHTGSFIFTGGEDGAIHMFDITCGSVRQVASWCPHLDPVNSLSFEFPWLVSASSDGKLSLINVRKLLKKIQHSSSNRKRVNYLDRKNIEPPQRMLHGSGGSFFSVSIGADRIICGGEEGAIKIWNFSQAFEKAEKVAASKALRDEKRMRRRKLQSEMDSRGSRPDQCVNTDRNGVWYNKRGLTHKVKG